MSPGITAGHLNSCALLKQGKKKTFQDHFIYSKHI